MKLMRECLAAGLGERGVYTESGTYYVSLIAEGCVKCGQLEEALSILAQTLAEVDQEGEGWWTGELHRLRGELVQAKSPANVVEAETSFQTAISIAQTQSAKSLELRAVTALACLWRQHGKRADARNVLMPVYDWFTEGFDTKDLKDAGAVLATLA